MTIKEGTQAPSILNSIFACKAKGKKNQFKLVNKLTNIKLFRLTKGNHKKQT